MDVMNITYGRAKNGHYARFGLTGQKTSSTIVAKTHATIQITINAIASGAISHLHNIDETEVLEHFVVCTLIIKRVRYFDSRVGDFLNNRCFVLNNV